MALGLASGKIPPIAGPCEHILHEEYTAVYGAKIRPHLQM